MSADDLELWVVELILPGVTGHTLWGEIAPDAGDRVLTADGNLLLFTSPDALRGFAVADQSSGFSGAEGYRRWLEIEDDQRDITVIDLVEVAASLALPAPLWDLARCSEVVDGLNMLGDVAASLGLEAVPDRWAQGVYGALLDGLTFVAEEDLPEAVAALDPRSTLGGFLVDLAQITDRSRVVA